MMRFWKKHQNPFQNCGTIMNNLTFLPKEGRIIQSSSMNIEILKSKYQYKYIYNKYIYIVIGISQWQTSVKTPPSPADNQHFSFPQRCRQSKTEVTKWSLWKAMVKAWPQATNVSATTRQRQNTNALPPYSCGLPWADGAIEEPMVGIKDLHVDATIDSHSQKLNFDSQENIHRCIDTKALNNYFSTILSDFWHLIFP